MLVFPAKTVYIDPAIASRPLCQARLERMLPNIQCGDIRELDRQSYAEALRARSRRHMKDNFGDDAVVVFTAFDETRLDWHYHLRQAAKHARMGETCQTALELNIVQGCVFRCGYCGFGRRVIVSLDVERLIEGLDEQFALYPAQSLYKFSNMTDLPPFEPEYDCIPPMVRRFAREPKRYLMLFTKSDNVDFLLDLDHGGRTIVSWSLASDAQARTIERRAPSMRQRIEAMAKAQQAGYVVRARLSPIVPVPNWRQECRALFEALFAKARPDLVTLEMLGWMDFEDLDSMNPSETLDPAAWNAAREAAAELRGEHRGPFPEALHQEVYRFCIDAVKEISPGTPVAVCHGTAPTWNALGSLMGMTPGQYICNCGFASTPGQELYDRLATR